MFTYLPDLEEHATKRHGLMKQKRIQETNQKAPFQYNQENNFTAQL